MAALVCACCLASALVLSPRGPGATPRARVPLAVVEEPLTGPRDELRPRFSRGDEDVKTYITPRTFMSLVAQFKTLLRRERMSSA